MTPQERQMIDDLFDRLAKLENAPRDADAAAAIAQGLRSAPNAVYPLVQTVLLQDEALKRANSRIQELEQAHPNAPPQSGGFLDSMRDAIFGPGSQSHSSVPNVPPPAGRPVWNSGQVLQQGQPGGPTYAQPSSQPYGQPYSAPPSSFGGGGGSFLGTAAAAAAGMVGGSLMLNSIRSMMGGSHYGFGGTTIINEPSPGGPWRDQSDSQLARDAGVNDVGLADNHADDNSRSGLMDQASNDTDDHDDGDHDDMDMDSDDYGNDGDTDDGGGDDGSSFA